MLPVLNAPDASDDKIATDCQPATLAQDLGSHGAHDPGGEFCAVASRAGDSTDCPVAGAYARTSSFTFPAGAPPHGPVHRNSANQNKKQWRHADEINKFHAAIQVCERRQGLAFSLNLSQSRIAMIEATATNDNSATRAMSHELNRYLSKHLGYLPMYAMGFEFCADRRLHVHGAIVLANGNHTTAAKRLLNKALSAAGGKIRGRAGSTQAHSTTITCGTGWFTYTIKTLERTKRMLGTGKVTFISRGLLQATRHEWESFVPTNRPKALR